MRWQEISLEQSSIGDNGLMTSNEQEFDVCPQGEEADSFHERILNGLQDRFEGLAGRYQAIMEIPESQRDQDERDLVSAYDRIGLELKRLEDPDLPYDKKYGLAQEIQLELMDMELL
jgi:hypothetical protein